MTHRLIHALFLLTLLTACGASSENKTGTPTPLPTTVPPTMTVTSGSTPRSTRTPSSTFTPKVGATLKPLPTDTPTFSVSATPSLSPTPETIPDAAIQIQAPGPMSKILSPIRLRGYILPGYKNRVRIELLGEDGRMLARQLTYVYTSQRWAYLSVDIPFEIKGAAEIARLQVSTEDEFGRINALSSVRLLLVSAGYDEINPPGNLWERCILISPQPEADVSGGTLIVDGKFRPVNSQPLIVELTTEGGQIIATRLVSMTPAEDDSYVPFVVDIQYLVEAPLPVLLSLRQSDDRIGGSVYLYSQIIILSP